MLSAALLALKGCASSTPWPRLAPAQAERGDDVVVLVLTRVVVGWTLSVWANDEARAAFVRSHVHREAIAKSLPALRGAEFKRLTVARKDLPADWDQVLRLLSNPEGRRNYWA